MHGDQAYRQELLYEPLVVWRYGSVERMTHTSIQIAVFRSVHCLNPQNPTTESLLTQPFGIWNMPESFNLHISWHRRGLGKCLTGTCQPLLDHPTHTVPGPALPLRICIYHLQRYFCCSASTPQPQVAYASICSRDPVTCVGRGSGTFGGRPCEIFSMIRPSTGISSIDSR